MKRMRVCEVFLIKANCSDYLAQNYILGIYENLEEAKAFVAEYVL